MASFSWKRKIGEKVSKSVVQHFDVEDERSEGDDDEAGRDEGVDWLHATKKRKEMLLEDCAAKSRRLKEEGTMLAEEGR
ncbi:Tetratricopeptide repeat protein 33, partial [Goodea atripinnis]